MTKYLVALLLAAASCATGQSITVISPLAIGNSAGGGAFLVPNNIAPSARSQQVYAASDFTRFCEGIPCGVPDGSPMWITEFHFVTIGGFFEANLQNVRIELSTTAKLPDGLSATFAENVGADNTVVYSGALRLAAGLPGFSLQTPFLYDPSRGNLLLDVRNFVTDIPPPLGLRQFLGENTFGDTVSQIISLDVNSTTARFVDSGGMLTRFQVTPIPEPSTVLLMVLAGSALVASGWRRRQSSFDRRNSLGTRTHPLND